MSSLPTPPAAFTSRYNLSPAISPAAYQETQGPASSPAPTPPLLSYLSPVDKTALLRLALTARLHSPSSAGQRARAASHSHSSRSRRDSEPEQGHLSDRVPRHSLGERPRGGSSGGSGPSSSQPISGSLRSQANHIRKLSQMDLRGVTSDSIKKKGNKGGGGQKKKMSKEAQVSTINRRGEPRDTNFALLGWGSGDVPRASLPHKWLAGAHEPATSSDIEALLRVLGGPTSLTSTTHTVVEENLSPKQLQQMAADLVRRISTNSHEDEAMRKRHRRGGKKHARKPSSRGSAAGGGSTSNASSDGGADGGAQRYHRSQASCNLELISPSDESNPSDPWGEGEVDENGRAITPRVPDAPNHKRLQKMKINQQQQEQQQPQLEQKNGEPASTKQEEDKADKKKSKKEKKKEKKEKKEKEKEAAASTAPLRERRLSTWKFWKKDVSGKRDSASSGATQEDKNKMEASSSVPTLASMTGASSLPLSPRIRKSPRHADTNGREGAHKRQKSVQGDDVHSPCSLAAMVTKDTSSSSSSSSAPLPPPEVSPQDRSLAQLGASESPSSDQPQDTDSVKIRRVVHGHGHVVKTASLISDSTSPSGVVLHDLGSGDTGVFGRSSIMSSPSSPAGVDEEGDVLDPPASPESWQVAANNYDDSVYEPLNDLRSPRPYRLHLTYLTPQVSSSWTRTNHNPHVQARDPMEHVEQMKRLQRVMAEQKEEKMRMEQMKRQQMQQQQQEGDKDKKDAPLSGPAPFPSLIFPTTSGKAASVLGIPCPTPFTIASPPHANKPPPMPMPRSSSALVPGSGASSPVLKTTQEGIDKMGRMSPLVTSGSPNCVSMMSSPPRSPNPDYNLDGVTSLHQGVGNGVIMLHTDKAKGGVAANIHKTMPLGVGVSALSSPISSPTNSHHPAPYSELRSIISGHGLGYLYFLRHLQREYASESLLFWKAMEDLLPLAARDVEREMLLLTNSPLLPPCDEADGSTGPSFSLLYMSVYNMYIKPGSKYEINISSCLRDSLKKDAQAHEAQLAKEREKRAGGAAATMASEADKHGPLKVDVPSTEPVALTSSLAIAGRPIASPRAIKASPWSSPFASPQPSPREQAALASPSPGSLFAKPLSVNVGVGLPAPSSSSHTTTVASSPSMVQREPDAAMDDLNPLDGPHSSGGGVHHAPSHSVDELVLAEMSLEVEEQEDAARAAAAIATATGMTTPNPSHLAMTMGAGTSSPMMLSSNNASPNTSATASPLTLPSSSSLSWQTYQHLLRAQQEIESLLVQDCLPRFKNSALYTKFILAAQQAAVEAGVAVEGLKTPPASQPQSGRNTPLNVKAQGTGVDSLKNTTGGAGMQLMQPTPASAASLPFSISKPSSPAPTLPNRYATMGADQFAAAAAFHKEAIASANRNRATTAAPGLNKD